MNRLRKRRLRLMLLLLLSQRELILQEIAQPLPIFRRGRVLQRRYDRLYKNNRRLRKLRLSIMQLER